MKTKMFISAILCFTVMLFAGCQGNGKPVDSSTGISQVESESNSSPEPTEVPVVTALLTSSQLPKENNSVQKEISKRLGIDFQPTIVAEGYEERFNTLAASKNLPDILKFYGYTKTMELINNGVLLALDDLLASGGQDVLENKAAFLETTIARVNGKLYGIPDANASGQVMMIRKDWLDNLGLPVPTTIDEFYTVMQAFTNQDPDQNGKNDTIGLAACINFSATFSTIFGAYGVPMGYPVMVEGEVVPYFMHPQYLEAVKFFGKLYSEGLMEPDFATIPNMNCLEKLWNGTYGCYDGDPIGTTNNWLTRYTEDPIPEMTYTVLKGPDGKGGVLRPIQDGSFVGINAASSHPEAAMKLINYVNSKEGDELVYAGIEGVHYEWKDGAIVYLSPFDDSSVHRDDGGFTYYYLSPRNKGVVYDILNDVTRYGLELIDENPVEDAYIYVAPEAEKNITFNPTEMLANLIVTQGDVEAEYQGYLDDYLNNGGQDWIKEATAIYNSENSK